VSFLLKDRPDTWFAVIPLPMEAERYQREGDLKKTSKEMQESLQVAIIFANREYMVFVFHNNCTLWLKPYLLHIQLLSQLESAGWSYEIRRHSNR
jgi:hypothetical protein